MCRAHVALQAIRRPRACSPGAAPGIRPGAAARAALAAVARQADCRQSGQQGERGGVRWAQSGSQDLPFWLWSAHSRPSRSRTFAIRRVGSAVHGRRRALLAGAAVCCVAARAVCAPDALCAQPRGLVEAGVARNACCGQADKQAGRQVWTRGRRVTRAGRAGLRSPGSGRGRAQEEKNVRAADMGRAWL